MVLPLIHPCHSTTISDVTSVSWQVAYVPFRTVERNSLLPSGKTKSKLFKADELRSCRLWLSSVTEDTSEGIYSSSSGSALELKYTQVLCKGNSTRQMWGKCDSLSQSLQFRVRASIRGEEKETWYYFNTLFLVSLVVFAVYLDQVPKVNYQSIHYFLTESVTFLPFLELQISKSSKDTAETNHQKTTKPSCPTGSSQAKHLAQQIGK